MIYWYMYLCDRDKRIRLNNCYVSDRNNKITSSLQFFDLMYINEKPTLYDRFGNAIGELELPSYLLRREKAAVNARQYIMRFNKCNGQEKRE